ncbi:MAG: VCBS repeat-containing protein [Chloroflexi bacterium]|nr:VCBS repeat-containing protein [Chloroflexota bacterium]
MRHWKKLTTLICSAGLLIGIHQPLAAAPRITPIASGPHLLGGVQNGKWIDAETTAQQLSGGESYRTYTTTGQIGSSKGSAAEPGIFCYGLQVLSLNPQPKTSEFAAIGGSHNPLPRKLRAHSINTPVYRQAVADLLRAQGIANPDVRITKIVRFDLEGDGVDEVVISATSAQLNTHFHAAAGDYSLVVLRKIINGKVQTLPIAQNYYPKATNDAPVSYTIPAIADFNGDGKLDIMVRESYFEGVGLGLYTVQGSKVAKVLGGGCGV